MTTVSVRYITDDVAAPVDSYLERLGFNVEMEPDPARGPLGQPDELFQPGGA